MSSKPLGLGLLGCGAFGLFCLKAFSRTLQIRLVAAARASRPPAREACAELGVQVYGEYRDVIEHPEVEIVHIATPPAHHHQLALAALRAGKHVLCEKPPALRVGDCEQTIRAARAVGRLFATDLPLRYSPVTEMVKRIIDSNLLGRPLAVFLTNCASDCGLAEDHWFWDNGISGGIFIEHGVHFFDLYRHWFGQGLVVSAHGETRQCTRHEDRVSCAVRHDNGVLADHWHEFDQIAPMDRTDHRVICEMGDIRVGGWVPMRLSIDAALDDQAVEEFRALCPGGRIRSVEEYGAEAQVILGRGRPRNVTGRVRLRYDVPKDKQALYADCVRALLCDQIAWIRDRRHLRRTTEDDSLVALRLAEAAASAAKTNA